LRMHILRGLRRDETVQRLPQLRRRLCPAPDPPRTGMAAGRVHDQADTVGPARASEVQPRGRGRALRTDTRRVAGGELNCLHTIIARSPCDEAIHAVVAEGFWIASLRSQ